MTTYPPITRQALTAVDAEQAISDVQRYFTSGKFTGGQFERFADGGDREAVASVFTSDDVVAVSLLSVRIPGRASLQLLGESAGRLTDLLREIPADIDLWDASDDLVGPQSAASQAWQLLMDFDGVGWVTAGKLMARKRPRLLPVYDQVVKRVLGRPDGAGLWLPLRDLLRDDPSVRERLGRIRSAAGIGDDISLLRVLDVVLWMRGDGRPEPAGEDV